MRMRRRSATTRLIVEASHVLHETVGVLFDSERDVAMHASGTAVKKVVS